MRPELIKSEKLILPLPLSQMHEIMVSFCMMKFEALGECEPTYLIQIPGSLMWIRTLWEDEAEKHASSQAVHKMLQLYGGISYSFASEVYLSQYTREELEGGDFVPPSQRQKRDEVLMINSYERGKPAPIFSRFLINSRPNNKLNFLGPRVDEEQNFAGLLMNLFLTREDRVKAARTATGAQI